MNYAVVTFGCRVNQADSLAIERDFLARGAVASTPEQADVVVVNTCSVTASADQGARQTIRRIVRGNPDVRVVVTGCYATRCAADVESLANVVRVVPNGSKDGLVSALSADLAALDADGSGEQLPARHADGDGPCGAGLAPGSAGRTAFTLRVQTGCEEHCSYCIIPRTRGASRSHREERVVADVERAAAAGYKEIVLTGVHLGSYGRDLGAGHSLETLLRRLCDLDLDVLFRVSSLEPMDCTPAIVDLAAAAAGRLAPHFHLPLQHGSDDVLRAMRRPYTSADYARLVQHITRLMPHAAIGSDVIVGFPGETDAQFAETLAVVGSLPLSHLHVFPYSDRPGTDASALPSKVGGAVIRERGQAVRALGQQLTRRFRAAQAGSVRRALTIDDGWSAVTDNYLKVKLDVQRTRNTWERVCVSDDGSRATVLAATA